MALRFCDSFDHYVTADILDKWTAFVSSPTISGVGRNGTSGVTMNSSTETMSKNLGSQATWIVGFAVRLNNSDSGDAVLFEFRDGATLHADLRITPGNLLKITRAGTALATGTKVLSLLVYYYVEVKVTIDDTVGAAIVRINGIEDINISGVDTRNAANASSDTLILRTSASRSVDYDDLYICDTTGSTNNNFLGDIRVQALFPTGNGNSSQLVGSDANSVDNYLLVDESAPNDDTDYVESSTVGEKDTYTFGDLASTSGTVCGLQILPFARKTDAGVRSIVSVARLSGTETDSTDKTLSTTYTYLPDIRETKPGGGAWTITNVNDAEFGVKITA
jgi:hypothetical protein